MKKDLAIFAKQIELLSKLPLRYLGDPILRYKCKQVPPSQIVSNKIQNLAKKLKSVLIKHRKITGGGRGLVANQIGGKIRMGIVWPFGAKEPEIIINPEITWRSKEKAIYHEICMSMLFIGIDVIRPYSVEISYYDLNGTKHQKKLDPQTSRLIQHEIDHLDGIVNLDRGNIKSTTLIFDTDSKKFAKKFILKKLD